ncbi:hypothetical protein ZWY2020_041524 [Hordeum vulgare]|nr:hypothetical protein ZWY2020_041524 [Hordeum vulgare]
MVPMVTEAWTLAGCGGAAASKPAAVAQEVPALLHPVAKKPISLRGVAAASSTCQDAAVVVGRCRSIASFLLTALALAGASSFGPLLTSLLKKQNNMTQISPENDNLLKFTRPILHGLCTLGFAARAVIKSFCNGDPTAVQNIFGGFLLHVYPSETLVTEMVQYQTKVKERDRAVLSGYVLLKQHIPSSL